MGARYVEIVASDSNDKVYPNDHTGAVNQFPLTLESDGVKFTFPIDPIITLGFKNVITRRTVSKGDKRGSVKERWSEDDVDITISGVFISSDESYPAEVDQLRKFFMKKKSVNVTCTLLNNLNIQQIAIESYNLPFTKGTRNQAYEIKAYSDEPFQLLIEG